MVSRIAGRGLTHVSPDWTLEVPATPQKPFDITEQKLQGFDSYDALAIWLCDEIESARAARAPIDLEIDYWHRIYEQARTRLETNHPRSNGADLTSPIGTQYVDSLHARAMQTVFGADRIWVVEGWGDSIQKAPFVEEFHQWTAEDERVQSFIDRVLLNAFIDGVGILEVFEETDYEPVRKTIWAQLQTALDPVTQQPMVVFDEKNQPVFEMGPDGKYIEVPEPPEGAPVEAGVAQLTIDEYRPIRTGPGYEVIDFSDFYTLPAHARSQREIYGYAKRFYRRFAYLQQKAKDGLYDAKRLEKIGDDHERQPGLDDDRRGTAVVAPPDRRTAEKELYEVAFKINLDKQGERWWIATIHVPSQTLLRLKYDDLGSQIGFGRFIRFVPMPRKNSVDGFSVIGHKLITIIEEHTAIRNMRADRSALATSAPLKVQQNALYDPEEQPFGAGAVIYVRDMGEIEPMVIPDVPNSLTQWEGTVLQGAERTIGLTDMATGVEPEGSRTATERSITVANSEVRSALIIRRLQESLEELGQVRHVIWKRVLSSQKEGMELPQAAMFGLEARGVDVTQIPGGKMTADLLEGKFRFKPRGSVDTANPQRQTQDFVQMLQMLPAVMQTNPMIAAMWQTPEAARALNERLVTLFRFPDRQAVLGMGAQQAGKTAQMLQAPQLQALLGGGAPMGGGMPAQGGPMPAGDPMAGGMPAGMVQ